MDVQYSVAVVVQYIRGSPCSVYVVCVVTVTRYVHFDGKGSSRKQIPFVSTSQFLPVLPVLPFSTGNIKGKEQQQVSS